MKKAIITGIRGQDGAYLAKLLLEKGYTVYGADRRSGGSDNWRLKELGIARKVKILYMDLLEHSNIKEVISKVMPDEVYNLAAQSFVGASFKQPMLTADVDAMGVLRLLDAIKNIKPDTKFYQASTSEMFGKVRETPQNELTPFHPRSPYAVSKVFSHFMTINYRESYDMFACSGILFNHESELRGEEFVTRKITKTLSEIKYNLADKVILGNLDSKRDWGYAPEYVYGMYLMLQNDKPDDYVLATNETHSIREFIEKACALLDFDIVWEGEGIDSKGIDRKTGKTIVEVSKEFYRPAEVDVLVGDYSKARKILGWEPKTKFDRLVEIMVESDLKRVEKSLG
ncbi:GDP-mannose 4,6-dehydratase [Thermodesulfobium sp. 4217-1]|uniref:GDP-mannose 4,6-dehydratase n=1 Tax=Thermodesulfobium sp. 4217-1 TaxID=3120013 RepID=UPI003221774A